MSVTDKVKKGAGSAAEAVEEKTAGLADDAFSAARSEAENRVSQGKEKASSFIEAISDAIDAGGDSLESDGYPGTASYVRYAANSLRSIESDVEGFRPNPLLDTAEDFVRHRPFLVYGALAVAGFAVASVFQRAERRRHRQQPGTPRELEDFDDVHTQP